MRPVTLIAALLVLAAGASPLLGQCTPPSITVSPIFACGTPATLDAGPGWATYAWTDSYGTDYGTAQSITTEFSGTYTVTVTDGDGCTSAASTPVTVSDFTIARAPAAACPNQVISNIEAVGYDAPTGTATFTWSITHGAIVSQDGMHADVMLDGSGPAELTVVRDDGAGCVASKSVTIDVASPLTGGTVSASAAAICPGETVTITATPAGGSGDYTYDWISYTDTVPSHGATITVSPSVSSWYYARITDNYGCGSEYTNAVQVVVNGTSADFTSPAAACENTTVTASAVSSSTATYRWQISVGTIEWGQDTPYLGFRVGSNGASLTLTVTDGGCTTSTSKFVAALHASAPTVTASGPTTFCAPGTVTLTSSPASGYWWSDGESTQSIIVSASGSYSVTATTAEGCQATSAPMQVTVLPAPSASVTGTQTICSGSAATVSAALTGTPPFTVTWNDGVVQTVPGMTASRSVVPASSTSYGVTAVSDANGCSGAGSGSAVVTVRTPPSAVVSGSATTCAGSPATVLASLSLTDYPVTVTWSDGTVQQVASGTTAWRTVTPATTTTYSVASVADSFCGGSASGSATITVDTPPAVVTQPSSVTIRKNATATFSVSATSNRPMTYQWYRGASGDISAPIANATASTYTTPRLSTTTSYWVQVSNDCGGTNSTTATATIK